MRKRVVSTSLGLATALVVPNSLAQTTVTPIEELVALRPLLDSSGCEGSVLVYDLRKDRLSGIGTETADQRRIPLQPTRSSMPC